MTPPNGLKPNDKRMQKQTINFIPAGYLYKKIANKPAWLKGDIEDIYSVSSCVSADFADYINYWQHNGYWLFDNPAIMEKIADEQQLDLTEMQLFYYELYQLEFDEDRDDSWQPFKEETSFTTDVLIPPNKIPMGFDVVTYTAGTSPECSPLSCNSLAEEITVNKHCLFNTFLEAKQALETGLFTNAEPGPYRIFAVYKVI